MRIKKFNINENEYSFVCEAWSNSRSWGHKVNLFRNNYEIAEARIRYYNRTWESYEFQSTMLKAINIVEEKHRLLELEYYRAKTGRKRLKQEEKEEIYKNSKQLQELQELKEKVRRSVW